MFNMGPNMSNQNLIVFLTIFIIIFLLYRINSNRSSEFGDNYNGPNMHSMPKYSDSVKKMIKKQEEILIHLRNKIDRKLMDKIKDKRNSSQIEIKLSTIESMDNKSIRSSKTKSPKTKSESNKFVHINQNEKINHMNQHMTKMSQQMSHHMNEIGHNMGQMNHNLSQITQNIGGPPVDPVYVRDNQVLNDKLYPPLGRTERPQFDLLMNYINTNPLFNVHTRGPPDTFRPIGYLTPTDNSGSSNTVLTLFGRAKYPNSDIGEFYVASTDKLSELKVQLHDSNSNVKKITDVPNVVTIGGHILNGSYNYTELKRPDLTYPYI